MLERILLETDLRIVILDPNSDFVRLRELHSLDDHNRLRRSPLSAEDFASVAARHAQAATDVRVLRPHPCAGDAEALRVQFSDLAAHEQSTVLQLDPLADRGEYSAFWRQADSLGDSYTLRDVEQTALRDLSVDARQLALRISNLGASNGMAGAGQTNAQSARYSRTPGGRWLSMSVALCALRNRRLQPLPPSTTPLECP